MRSAAPERANCRVHHGFDNQSMTTAVGRLEPERKIPDQPPDNTGGKRRRFMATDAAAKEAGRLPQLVASGQWLTTKDGEVAILRGVNLVSKTSKTPEELGFDERSAQLLQDRGFSVVRLGVLWCNVEPYLSRMARTTSTTSNISRASSGPSSCSRAAASTRWLTSTRTPSQSRGATGLPSGH